MQIIVRAALFQRSYMYYFGWSLLKLLVSWLVEAFSKLVSGTALL